VSRRDWIRVRGRWFTDPDHADVSFDALGLGVYLMHLADGDPGWREKGDAWIMEPDGRPMKLGKVARLIGKPPNFVKRCASELVACCTMAQRKDGAFGFPNYRKHQEDPSAARKRKQRSESDCHVTVPANVTGEEKKKRREEEEIPPKPPSGRKKRTGITAEERTQAEAVLAHLSRRAGEFNSRARGFGPTDANCREIVKRLRDGVGVDELLDVINAKATECRADASSVKWLNPSTPFRDANWPLSQALANEWRQRGGGQGVQVTGTGYAKVGPDTNYEDGEVNLNEGTSTP